MSAPAPTQKVECDHPELVTLSPLPEAESEPTAELKPPTQGSVDAIVTHLRQRQIFKMEEALQTLWPRP